MSGERLGIDTSPNNEYQPPMPTNVVERRFADRVNAKFPDRRVTMAREPDAAADREVRLEDAWIDHGATLLPWRADAPHQTLSFHPFEELLDPQLASRAVFLHSKSVPAARIKVKFDRASVSSPGGEQTETVV